MVRRRRWGALLVNSASCVVLQTWRGASVYFSLYRYLSFPRPETVGFLALSLVTPLGSLCQDFLGKPERVAELCHCSGLLSFVLWCFCGDVVGVYSLVSTVDPAWLDQTSPPLTASLTQLCPCCFLESK